MTSGRGRARGADGESGSALIIVLMMISMLGVLTLTMATLSVNNLTGARRAHEAGVALNAADAGLAQAVAYMRGNGVGGLACSPTCASNPWGNSAAPQTVTVPGTNGASLNVWVEPLAPYPANKEGLYKVHSKGVAGSLGGRSVTADVMVAPQKFPLGIFAMSISGGGNAGVHYSRCSRRGACTNGKRSSSVGRTC